MRTFKVNSSAGHFVCDSNSGKVLEYDLEEDDDYRQINRFDIEEWLKYYSKEFVNGIEIDILDIGIFSNDGSYNSPDSYFRKIINIKGENND